MPAAAQSTSDGAEAGLARYSRRVWQSSDGLPEDFAQALAQTGDEYLWIGTSGGLVRFDGVSFVLFNSQSEPAFRDDSIYTLLAARDGTLWAGTEGGGVIRYRDGRFRAFGMADGITNLFVRVLFEDRSGALWVGTDRGLFRLEGDTFRRIDDRGNLPSMSVHSIEQDRTGRLLVGGGGLLVLAGSRAVHYTSSQSLADNSVRTILEGRNGTVWMGTISGLRRLDGGLRGDPFVVPRVFDGNVSVVAETRSGQPWIGTYGRGVMRFHEDGALTLSAPAALPHDNVLAIFEDAEANVWIGTQGGLLRLRPSAGSTITTADATPLTINTIYEDPGGTLLVAALNGRLFRVQDDTLVQVDLPAGLDELIIRNVFRDSRNRLWIGTDGQGVARLDRGEVDRFTMDDGLVNDFIRAFCEDRDGGMWIGTDGGLSYWRAGTFRSFTPEEGLVYGSIRQLLLDRDGSLWVATERGLSLIRSGAFVHDPILEHLRGHKVWALHQDGHGGLWIGTQGAGLFLLKAGRIAQFTTEQGLPSNKVHFIGEDAQRHLWMSGPRGVVSVLRDDLETLSRDTTRQVAVRVYGTAEGLSTSQMMGGVQPAGVVTSTGEVWLPSTTGAVRVVPDTLDHGTPPPLLVEQIIADDQPIPLSANLTLPPGDGKLEIHYTSIRLGAPERVRFKYWMEGFEREWTHASQRRVAYYTNLPPGRYRFHVLAYEMNAPQQVSERILSLELQPHFYQTYWFVACCALIVATAGLVAYRIHVHNIRRQFAAVLEERNRLAREMHDTLIQGCIGVSTLLEAAVHARDVAPSMSHELLQRARTEVRAAVDEARLAVWNLRRCSSNEDRLVPVVADLAHRMERESGTAITLEVGGAPVALDGETERGLMMLIREALQNAIQHAAPRRVDVTLRFDARTLEVEIADDGRGFDTSREPSSDSHHYGLLGMRERAASMGGDFQLTSAPGRGTHVYVHVPLTHRKLGA